MLQSLCVSGETGLGIRKVFSYSLLACVSQVERGCDPHDPNYLLPNGEAEMPNKVLIEGKPI